MKPTGFWLWVLGGVFALCLVCAALLPRLFPPGHYAQVVQNGTVLYTLPLNEPAELTLTASNGGRNTITVRDGRICVSHATCPDQVCVNQGWTDNPATPIVCLPNGLILRIQGGDSGLDAQTK